MRLLYISGSIGLGHVIRDRAVANHLRALEPGLQIEWLAGMPAANILQDEGEKLLPESKDFSDLSGSAEAVSSPVGLNLFQYVLHARKGWKQNSEVFQHVLEKYDFDCIVANEAYELEGVFLKAPHLKNAPFVMIHNFVGLACGSRSLLERVGVYILNKYWIRGYRKKRFASDLSLFAGELEDIPDTRFGVFLPNRREYALHRYTFVGYTIAFDPKEYENGAALKQKLGYGTGSLVVCSVGGTALGRSLLSLCSGAYSTIKEAVPGCKMLIVCGPRIDPGSLQVPRGIEVRGYIPKLYEHFAACDFAIVQAGGTTTLELTALGKPFIYFPLEGQSEHEDIVKRLTRHGAGILFRYTQASESRLAGQIAETVIDHLQHGKNVTPHHAAISFDGAQKSASIIHGRFLAG